MENKDYEVHSLYCPGNEGWQDRGFVGIVDEKVSHKLGVGARNYLTTYTETNVLKKLLKEFVEKQ